MECDNWRTCKTSVGPRPSCDDLPLEEFAAAGLFIAHTHSDCCPACVAAAGGMDTLTKVRDQPDSPGRPHSLMAKSVTGPS
jgi:hypothetical protein